MMIIDLHKPKILQCNYFLLHPSQFFFLSNFGNFQLIKKTKDYLWKAWNFQEYPLPFGVDESAISLMHKKEGITGIFQSQFRFGQIFWEKRVKNETNKLGRKKYYLSTARFYPRLGTMVITWQPKVSRTFSPELDSHLRVLSIPLLTQSIWALLRL